MVDPAGDVEVVGCRHDRRTGSRQPAQLLRHAIRRIGVEADVGSSSSRFEDIPNTVARLRAGNVVAGFVAHSGQFLPDLTAAARQRYAQPEPALQG
jgi:hypothetical protein